MLTPRDILSDIPSYHAGQSAEQKTLLKLSSNENPLGPAVSLADCQDIALSLYPKQENSPLLSRLSEKHSVNHNQLILGNGSDELFQLMVGTFINKGDEVLTSAHTFSMYDISTRLFEGVYKQVPMSDMAHNLPLFKTYLTDKTKIIFLANPNNPTGSYATADELSAFFKEIPSHILIVIDEAYIDYVDAAEHIDIKATLTQHPNVMFTRTFSKIYGLAGLRLGYAIGHASSIQLLHRIKPPFNVNSLALKAGELAIQKQTHIENSIRINKEGYDYMTSFCKENNLKFTESKANFICIHLPFSGSKAFSHLAERGIFIRDLASFGLSDAIRITLAPIKDLKLVCDALKLLL